MESDEESKEETMLMDWLDCKFFTTLFVDGNHENFDRLYDYMVEEWHRGNTDYRYNSSNCRIAEF